MFVLLVADTPVILPDAELWALNDRLNDIVDDVGAGDELISSAAIISDDIESEDYGPGRTFSRELVPTHVQALLRALSDEFVREWPFTAPLRDALLAHSHTS